VRGGGGGVSGLGGGDSTDSPTMMEKREIFPVKPADRWEGKTFLGGDVGEKRRGLGG